MLVLLLLLMSRLMNWSGLRIFHSKVFSSGLISFPALPIGRCHLHQPTSFPMQVTFPSPHSPSRSHFPPTFHSPSSPPTGPLPSNPWLEDCMNCACLCSKRERQRHYHDGDSSGGWCRRDLYSLRYTCTLLQVTCILRYIFL